MLRAHWRATKQTRGASAVIITLRICGILLLLSSIVGLVKGYADFKGAIPTLVIGALCVGLPLLQSFTLRRRFRSLPNRDKTITWEITEDRLTTKTEFSSVEMAWAALIRAVRVSDGFLFSTHVGSFHWLPNHAFHDPSDIDRLADLAKAKAQRYEHAR